MENLDPVLGVVRWAVERVEEEQSSPVDSESSEGGRSVSFGIDVTQRRKSLLHAHTKRQPEQGSQGKCAR